MPTGFPRRVLIVALASACNGDGGSEPDDRPAVTAPLPGAVVSGRVTLAAEAGDDRTAGMQFHVDGVVVGGEDLAPPYTASWESWHGDDGVHTITATARSADGALSVSPPVQITVSNTATTGAVHLGVSTGGPHRDADGYMVSIGGGAPLAVGTSGTHLFPAVAAGTHAITVTGVARNCTSAADAVTVTPGSGSSASLYVTCTAVFAEDIAFTRYGAGLFNQVYSAGADGVSPANLSANSPYNDRSPDWSPDGASIAFVSDRGGTPAIYVMSPDGSGSAPLVQRPVAVDQPRWSPGGAKIAYVSNGIWVDALDGSEPVALIGQPAGALDHSPVWSPDGTRIAFARQLVAGSIDLMIADVASGEAVTARAAAPGEQIVPTDWDEAGGVLLLVSGGSWGTDGDLAVVDPDGTGFQTLTVDGLTDSGGAWTADGSGALFATTRFGGGVSIGYVSDDGELVFRVAAPPAGQHFNTPAPRPLP